MTRRPRLATSPCREHVDKSATRRTASMEQAADRAEAAKVDHYFSPPTENCYAIAILAGTSKSTTHKLQPLA